MKAINEAVGTLTMDIILREVNEYFATIPVRETVYYCREHETGDEFTFLFLGE
jgi:hypothetical protein